MWRDYLTDDDASLASNDEEEESLLKYKHRKKNKPNLNGESSDAMSPNVSNYKIESRYNLDNLDVSL